MTDHVSISADEAADRLAIRELVDAYAFCADTRDADGQKALFTSDTHFIVYMEGEGSNPTDDLHGRESLTPVLESLNTYELTMHFNGQSTVALDGDRASVVARFTNFAAPQEIVYRYTRESGRWRIDDIEARAPGDHRWTLSRILAGSIR